MTNILEIRNLSKQYRLGNVGTGTLSHDLNRWWHKIRGKEDPFLTVGETNDRSTHGNSDYVWALQDINFDVKQGEVLGIIGKNGAGKSTLLKILSKVTGPTTGHIETYGRIASLLEVGTGFHPELTGRENIFLNGAILGMSKKEIARKFDEIVDFAGVERYIDTPVKRYSSGMYVRLAFAVAAHLEPEILVVDEVLAVGDAEFQKKAIGKMKDVAQGHGRTVLFVSHNMAAVKSLCDTGILLKNGTIVHAGTAEYCVGQYLQGDHGIENYRRWKTPEIKTDDFELHEIGIKATNKDYTDTMRIDDELIFNAVFTQNNPDITLDITLHVKDGEGNKIFSTSSGEVSVQPRKSGSNVSVSCTFPADFFNWGNFFFDVYFVENSKRAQIIERDLISFTLQNKELQLGVWMGKEPGAIKPKFPWSKTIN